MAVVPLVVAVVAFSVAATGEWLVPSGAAFAVERSGPASDVRTGQDAAAQARRDGVDVDAVRDAVRHRTVGPERPVSDPAPDPVPAIESEMPSVAFDGTNYLVAWSDGRGRGPTNRQVYAARVTRAGTVLDEAGIVLSDDGSYLSGPSVAFDGDNFLVVWGQLPVGVRGIHGNRVDPSGTVLDGSGFVIAAGDFYVFAPSVAFDGTNHLVVWDGRGAADQGVFGARVSPAGTVLDPVPIEIGTGARDGEQPSVAFDGTNFLVVWVAGTGGGYGDLRGARVSTAGVVLDPAGIVIAAARGRAVEPALAFDGANYLVVWASSPSAPDLVPVIGGARVSPAGVVLDPSAIAISDERWDIVPAVTFDGTDYLVVWANRYVYTSMFGSRVSPDGTVLDPRVELRTGRFSYNDPAALAFDGTNHLLVSAAYEWDKVVSGVRVSREVVVLDDPPIVVSTAANGQFGPVVGFDGTNYLVVWTDNRTGGQGIYGARVRRDGTILDGAGFRIPGDHRPAIAFDGTNYLVVAEAQAGDNSIVGTRVGPDGVVLDPEAIPLGPARTSQADVTFDGANFLVAWLQAPPRCNCDPNPVPHTIEGAIVSPAGEVSARGVIAPAFAANGPSVASDGTNSLVVWRDDRNGWETTDIYGTRVSRNLEVLDGAGIPISTAAGTQHSPDMAFDGWRYLVAWSDSRADPDSSDVYGARVGRSGVVRDPEGIPISVGPGRQDGPRVGANGRFFVIWSDDRSAPYVPDVYGARVSGSGQVLDPDGIAIATGPTTEYGAAVAAGPGRRFAAVYTRYAPEAPYGTTRAFLRTVAPK